MKKIFFIFVILFNFNIKITAGEISGFPVITDGDTIKILNNRIRLHGIDAPEKKQRCIKKSKNYKCGSVATIELTKKINKNLVKCSVQKNKDRYNRYIGVCFINSQNLNKWMVRNGFAVAYKRYSKDYVLDEEYAKKNRLGLWSGEFLRPEKWRKLN
jgi:endonuclease YncB( thermonuclease family)|tara:strand:+ start:4118 stop:4588 length:471 start_codon:yes stop_codon:yes gene_type:complete